MWIHVNGPGPTTRCRFRAPEMGRHHHVPQRSWKRVPTLLSGPLGYTPPSRHRGRHKAPPPPICGRAMGCPCEWAVLGAVMGVNHKKCECRWGSRADGWPPWGCGRAPHTDRPTPRYCRGLRAGDQPRPCDPPAGATRPRDVRGPRGMRCRGPWATEEPCPGPRITATKREARPHGGMCTGRDAPQGPRMPRGAPGRAQHLHGREDGVGGVHGHGARRPAAGAGPWLEQRRQEPPEGVGGPEPCGHGVEEGP